MHCDWSTDAVTLGALQTPKSWKIVTQFASDVYVNKLTMCVGKPSSCGCQFLFTFTLERDYIKSFNILQILCTMKEQTIIDVFSKGFVKTQSTKYFSCCINVGL